MLIKFFILFLSYSFGVANATSYDKLSAVYISALEDSFSNLQNGAVAIIESGQVIYQKTFGTISADNPKPITSDTLFSLASLSKPIVSTVFANLVANNKISLSSKISDIITLKQPNITVYNILSNTSGYNFRGDYEIEHGLTRAQIINLIKKQKPTYKLGEKFYYSNAMYFLTQDIIAKRIQQHWQTVVYDFYKKIDANNLYFCQVPDNIDLAFLHTKKHEKIIARIPANYPEKVCSSAGGFASLNDLIKFLKLNMGYFPDVLSKQDLEDFHKSYVEANEPIIWIKKIIQNTKNVKASYGLGWRIIEFKNNKKSKMIFHPGSLNGVRGFVGFIPEYDIGIILITGQEKSKIFEHGIKFWDTVVN